MSTKKKAPAVGQGQRMDTTKSNAANTTGSGDSVQHRGTAGGAKLKPAAQAVHRAINVDPFDIGDSAPIALPSVPEEILQLVKQGWSVFPCRAKTDEEGKVKAPITGWGGSMRGTRDEEKLEQWAKQYPGCMWGATPPDGVWVMDIDPRNGGDATLKELLQGAKLPSTPYAATAGGGWHYVFKDDAPAGKLGNGIDIKRGGKGYVIVAPSVNLDTDTAYQWRRAPWSSKPAKAPAVLQGVQASANDQQAGTADFGNLGRAWSKELAVEVRAALKQTDPDLDYSQWIAMGQALHSADPSITGQAFDAWDRWSQRGEKYEQGDCEKHWQSFKKTGGITINTLFGIAKEHGVDTKKLGGKYKDGQDKEDTDPLPFTLLSDIPRKAVAWLIPYFAARGVLTIVGGDGGMGKSSMMSAVAHKLIHGGHWPLGGVEEQGVPVEPCGRVVWLASEEDAGSQIGPRFDAQGTDTKNVAMLGMDKDKVKYIRFDKDMERVEQAIKVLGDVCAVFIDPLTGYLGSVNQNDEGELRNLLMRLVDMAARCGVALIANMHLNKKGDVPMLDRLIGGTAFKTVARHVVMAVKDPDDLDTRRLFIVQKSNFGSEGATFTTNKCSKSNPLAPNVPLQWCEIDNEGMHGLNADDVNAEVRKRQVEQNATRTALGIAIQTALRNADDRTLGTAAIAAQVLPGYMEANNLEEMTPSAQTTFNNTLAVTLSRLCSRRVLRRMRKPAAGVEQQYQLVGMASGGGDADGDEVPEWAR